MLDRRAGDEPRWQFDPAGRPRWAGQRSGWRYTLAYDAAGRLASVTNPFGRRILLTHDAARRLPTASLPDGNAASHGDRARGPLTTAVSQGGPHLRYPCEAPHLPPVRSVRRCMSGRGASGGGAENIAEWKVAEGQRHGPVTRSRAVQGCSGQQRCMVLCLCPC